MAQTKEGARKMQETIRKRYGLTKDGKSKLHVKIGAEGGKKSTTGGFWHAKYVLGDIEHVRDAGRKGGTVSVRKAKK